MAKNRVRDWRELPAPEWRQQVTSDLDELDDDVAAGLRAIRNEIAGVKATCQTDNAEVKEQQKWILRTMWALLVGLMMVFAGVAATVVVP